MPPAARITDPTTHGAPLAPGPGSLNVLIGGMPAWRAVIDQHACPAANVTGPDGVGSVLLGSPTVFINSMMACRMGDIVIEKPGLALGPMNPILMGCPTVLIGEVGMGSTIPTSSGSGMAMLSTGVPGEAGNAAQALAKASQKGSATVPVGRNPTLAQAAGAGSGSDSSTSPPGAENKKTWVEIELLDAGGKPVANEPYRIEAPDGSVSEGCTDDRGVARVTGIDPGNCKISFPALDQQAWTKA